MTLSWRVVVTVITALVATVVLIVTLATGNQDRGSAAAVGGPGASESADPDGAGQRQIDPFTVAVQGYDYGEPGFAATRDKAQSKLWFHDGSWWAPMIDPFTAEVHIFELRDSTWVDTGTFIDARSQSNADVVWTGERLYIASRTSTGDLLLQRYAWAPERRWVPETPGGELIARGGGQSLTIAVDTQDRVWGAWVVGGRVQIASSEPGGVGWSTPVTPPGGEEVQDDDGVAVTRFGNGQVGVLWSNQQEDAFLWTSREDSAPVGEWAENVTVDQGVNIADGHINFAIGPTGQVHAAVKTSLGDDGEPLQSELIEVLSRAEDGTWTASTAATVGNQMTRAQLVLSADGRYLVLVATSPQSGGSIFYKVAEAADPRFPPGKGSLLIGWEGAVLNDPTTARDVIDPAIPLVVLASDSRTGRYYHAELSLADILSPQ